MHTVLPTFMTADRQVLLIMPSAQETDSAVYHSIMTVRELDWSWHTAEHILPVHCPCKHIRRSWLHDKPYCVHCVGCQQGSSPGKVW